MTITYSSGFLKFLFEIVELNKFLGELNKFSVVQTLTARYSVLTYSIVAMLCINMFFVKLNLNC